jgi:hypothetical protein
LEPSIQRLVDEAEIRDLHLKYCRGVDRMDFDLIRSCYHPDATDDHGSFQGGVDAFIEFCKGVLPTFVHTTHYACNQLVKIEGDKAWAENYTYAVHRKAPTGDNPGVDIIMMLRYVDRLERRNGEWRFADRTLAVDAERVDKIGDLDSLGFGVPITSKRDKSDICYKR